MTLFEECLQALGNKAEALSVEETNNNFKNLTNMFPMTSWGRVDWGRIENKIEINEVIDIKEYLNSCNRLDKTVILLWDEATLPAVKTDLEAVIDNIDDITAVSFDTWIFCPESRYLIEFYHESEVTLGML